MSVFCVGRCGWSHKKVKSLPAPRVDARGRLTILLPTSWADVQKGSRALRPYPLRIPWIASAVVRQAKHASFALWAPELGWLDPELVVEGVTLLSFRTRVVTRP